MHVVSTTTIVARILTEIKEFLDVHVPRFKVRANSSLAFSALIDRDGRVVHNLQERNHTLAATVCAFDVRIRCTNTGPVVAKTARPLAELCVVRNTLEDVFQIVFHS